MKPKAAKTSTLLKRVAALVIPLVTLLGVAHIARAESLITEHFDENVTNTSPVGLALGWHAYALHGGVVTDFTDANPGPSYPNLSHLPDGAGASGGGYLVMGAGDSVSNVLVWVDCAMSFREGGNGYISFYARNDAPASTQRAIVRVAHRWYASTRTFHGSVSSWVLNTLALTRSPTAWRSLNTNTLLLGAVLTNGLPTNEVTAVGVFGEMRPDAGKLRIDEFLAQTGSKMNPALNPADAAADPKSVMDPDYLVGCWIWTDPASDQQTCRFWKSFSIPRGVFVHQGRIRIVVDNSYRAFLDGMEFGRSSDWKRIAEYDLTEVLTPGPHVLAVEAFNETGSAGLVAGISVNSDDGRVLEIPSDASWRIVPEEEKGWRTRKTPRQSWPKARALFRFRDWPNLPDNPPISPRSPFHAPVLKFWQQPWFQITLLAFSAVVVAVCLRLLAQLALQSRARQVLHRERARIARDIHDDFGGALTQLVLLGEAAQTESAMEPQSRARFAQVSESGRRLLRSIDEVVWLVNSQRDSLRDFETYVSRYAENFFRATPIRCRLEMDAEIPEAAFDLAARRSFFLAIKEALNNVLRHSAATEVLLTIHVERDQIRVTVADNGKGFEPAKRDPSRNGLCNMAQRLAEVRGQCRVLSRPGAGCRVELSAPVSHRRHRPLAWWRPRPRQPASLPEAKRPSL